MKILLHSVKLSGEVILRLIVRKLENRHFFLQIIQMNGLGFYEQFELLDDDSYDDTVHEYNEQQFEQFDDDYEVMLCELIEIIILQRDVVVLLLQNEQILIVL
ncbi:MAG: hypothetical protein K6E76_08790 [Patescibacteria group bacterium]|nr:hypothetical protein [Patescibacteria group bacterium]